ASVVCGARHVEVRVIKHIERFASEPQSPVFAHVDILGYGEVGIPKTWSATQIATDWSTWIAIAKTAGGDGCTLCCRSGDDKDTPVFFRQVKRNRRQQAWFISTDVVTVISADRGEIPRPAACRNRYS